MATNFPGSVDDAATVGDGTHPSADEALSSTTGGPAHHALHQNVGLAINAIEDKVGTGASTPAANTVLTGTGSGTSAWATVSTAMIGDDQVTAAKVADDAVTKVVVTDTTDATAFPALFESATGNLTPHTDAGLTYNASNATLTATTFVGALTGDASGSSGSCTGNAATASVATTVTLTDEGSDTTCFPVFAQTATGNIALETDASALTYNASNGTLSATSLAGTLTTVAQTNITSVGTLDDLTVTGVIDANGVVKIIDGSVGSPALVFDSDEDNGIFLQAADVIGFVGGGNETFRVVNNGVLVPGSHNYFAVNPSTGTGNDAEWSSTGFGTYMLKRNSSLTAEKENITADLGSHLTADMIDSVVPKMWNRTNSPGYPEIGPLAEDMNAISPFLAAHGADIRDGTYKHFLTGINKTAYLSLLVLAVKDLRTQVADLTTRLAALEG